MNKHDDGSTSCTTREGTQTNESLDYCVEILTVPTPDSCTNASEDYVFFVCCICVCVVSFCVASASMFLFSLKRNETLRPLNSLSVIIYGYNYYELLYRSLYGLIRIFVGYIHFANPAIMTRYCFDYKAHFPITP